MTDSSGVAQLVGRLAEIGDPVRMRMLRVLESEELSVGEIARVLQIPQSTASRHLKMLNRGGWLTSRSAKTATFYRLVQDDLGSQTRPLWRSIRDHLAGSPEAAEDARRLRDVMAQRATDSLSFFGRVAGEWDAMRAELFGDRFLAEGLIALLPSDWTVADLGCGTGNAAALLVPCVERVIAIDQSGPMLDAARRRVGRDGLDAHNVEFLEGTAESIPLTDAAVDAVVASLVLHHVPDPAAVLREARRVLRTDRGGGQLLVIDMEAHGRREYRHTMGHSHLGFDGAVLSELFTSSGFEEPRLVHLPSEPGATKGPGLFAAVARAAVPAGSAADSSTRADSHQTQETP